MQYNKGADQLCSYRADDLCLCFLMMRLMIEINICIKVGKGHSVEKM